MAWSVTLKIVDCAAASSLISGAQISSPYLVAGTIYTDANGEAIVYDPNTPDVWEFVIVTISKGSTGAGDPGYTAKNFTVSRTQNGTVQTVCLNKAPPPAENGTGTEVTCFIVSAATGSSASAEVVSLRLLRDRVCAASGIGAALVDAVYDEYRRFSPGIAVGLEQDDLARRVALEVVVRPLFAWYSCAGTLGFGDCDEAAARAAARDVGTACERHETGVALLGLLDAVRAQATLPPEAPAVAVELASRLAEFPFASWAILDPLVRAWRAAIEDLDVVDEVAEWLVAAPFEALDRPVDEDALGTEFAVLEDFLAFRPSMRARLGDRLHAAWPYAPVRS